MASCKLVNVVATASLYQKLDFGKLGLLKEVSYNPDVYGGRVAYFKSAKMVGRVSLFLTGKMISVGTKSEQNAFLELELAKDFLVKRGLIDFVKLQPQIRNLVFSCNLNKVLNLEEIFANNQDVIYEPEQFPAVVTHLDEPCKASVLIFASGKIVIVGLKNTSEIELVLEKVQKIANY